MKLRNKALALLMAAVACFSAGAGANAGLTSIFELDTRGAEWANSSVFALDTRDPDTGTLSAMFTLDTRGVLEPLTPVFTLDTRGWDEDFPPTNLLVRADQLTIASATWEYYGTPLGFIMERRSPLGEWSATTITGATTRAWVDATVLPGEFYEYRVAAWLTDGASEYSDVACIQMPAMPDAPCALQAHMSGADQAALSWQDRSHNEDGFDIWRKTGPAGTWGSLAQVGANVTSYLDGAVSDATLYTYKVRAFNSWGESAFSDEASVSTPGAGGDCGFELLVEDAVLQLDGIAAATNMMHSAGRRALLEGSLSVFVSAPPGYPHPIRVVLGYRNQQGQAVGNPVELLDFYGAQACPGVVIETDIPGVFRAPEEGTNTLWIEMIMAQRDPVTAFMTERHTQEAPMRKRIFDVGICPSDMAEIKIRVVGESTTPGNTVRVPIQLVSAGGEQRLAFSLAFDEGLQWVGTDLGEDAQQVWLQSSEQASNAVGLVLKTPTNNPLAEGSKHLLTLTCLAEQPGDHLVHFQDAPVGRAITGGAAETATISWEDGHVLVAGAGLEGDVAPYPQGDGLVDEADAKQAMLFVLGVQAYPTNAVEFQRLDAAPVETCGDGMIDMADVVAIRKYGKGDWVLRDACGPTNPVAQMRQLLPKGATLRSLSMKTPADVVRGSSFQAPIVLVAQGDEHALALSVAYDDKVLAYQELRLLGLATNADFLPNIEAAAEGGLAFGLSLPPGETFVAGTQTVAEIQFLALEGLGIATSPVAFAQSPAECLLVDTNSEPLDSAYFNSEVAVYDVVAASAPYPPENVKATALSTSQIKISWESAPFSTGYRVRRKLDGETGWSIIAELDSHRTVLVDEGLSAGALGEYLVTSVNPLGEESSAVAALATTWTVVEDWRLRCFDQVENEGWAADTADPDGDDIPNLLEYQLGFNPMVPDGAPFVMGVEEIFAGTPSVVFRYVVSNNAPGRVSFDSTADLLGIGSWAPQFLAPVMRMRQGDGEQIMMRVPESARTNEMMFLRMKAE